MTFHWFLAATRRSSSFWIAALPTQGVQQRPPYWTIASSLYKASAAATSPRLSAARSCSASDAGSTSAGAGVDTARASIDASKVTKKIGLFIDQPPVARAAATHIVPELLGSAHDETSHWEAICPKRPFSASVPVSSALDPNGSFTQMPRFKIPHHGLCILGQGRAAD